MNGEELYSLALLDGPKPLLFSADSPVDCSKISLDTKASLCVLQGSMDQNVPEYAPKVIQNTPPHESINSYPQEGRVHIDNTQIAPINIVNEAQDPSISISLKNVKQFKTELKVDAWTGLPEKIVAEGLLGGTLIKGEQSFGNTTLAASKGIPLGLPHFSASGVGVLDRNIRTSDKNLTAALNFEYDFRYLLDTHPSDQEKWAVFYEKLGIEITPEEKKHPGWIQAMAVRFLVANSMRMTPETIERNFFIQLGVEFQGGVVSVGENSPLLKMDSFRAGFGMGNNDTFGLIGSGYLNRREDLSEKTSMTSTLYGDPFHTIGRFSLDHILSENESGNVSRVGVFAEVGNTLRDPIYIGTGIMRENTATNGHYRSYGIGVGTTGPILRMGMGSKLYGDTNKLLSISPTGAWLETTRNPGTHITNNEGEVFAQYESFFQMIQKSPEDKQLIQYIIARLEKLGEQYSVIITENFAHSLSDRKAMNLFIQYLDTNQGFFSKQDHIRTIQFERMDDWLDFARNTQGTSFEKETGLLRVRSIEHALDSTVLDVSKRYDILTEKENISSLLVSSGMKVRSEGTLSEGQILSIESLLKHAQDIGFFDRLKGKTLEIINENTEGHIFSEFDPNRQVIRMTTLELGKIEQAGLTGDSPRIEGWGRNDILGILANIVPKESIHTISRVRVVEAGDSALINPFDQTRMPFDSENGVLTIGREHMDMLRELSEKKAQGTIGFFEKIRLHAFVQKVVQAQTYPLVQFDDFLRNSMPSLQSSLSLTKKLAGSGTLYDLRPMDSVKLPNKNVILERSYGIFQTNLNTQKHRLNIQLLANEVFQVQFDDATPFSISNRSDLENFKQQRPEFSKLVLGLKGQDKDGNEQVLRGILADMLRTKA